MRFRDSVTLAAAWDGFDLPGAEVQYKVGDDGWYMVAWTAWREGNKHRCSALMRQPVLDEWVRDNLVARYEAFCAS